MGIRPIAISARKGATAVVAVALVGSLAFPAPALAQVFVDTTEIFQGENSVGGGTATWADDQITMTGVTADHVTTDENVDMHFDGDNTIGNVEVTGDASVEMSFTGSNEVEEVHTWDSSHATINANGHDTFEEIEAHDQSSVDINVTGRNTFEEITASDDASVAIHGTSCQRRDVAVVGDDEEDTNIWTERGNLTIDHVTVELAAGESFVGSLSGKVNINTSKIAAVGDARAVHLRAGDQMDINESVLDFPGDVIASGPMNITHSDMHITKSLSPYEDDLPYRVFSRTEINLLGEANGRVRDGEYDDDDVRWLDTGDDDEVDLHAAGSPDYYRCGSDSDRMTALPKTGDAGVSGALAAALAGAGSLAVGVFLTRRRA